MDQMWPRLLQADDLEKAAREDFLQPLSKFFERARWMLTSLGAVACRGLRAVIAKTAFRDGQLPISWPGAHLLWHLLLGRRR